ncbi:MAG: tetratricopeptide repeat protein, partial [Alphaproteobacteria bacterium]
MAEGSVTGRKRRRWVSWALVAGFLALQTTAAWAEPVRVRAALHDDFGRVVFSWNSPVSHKSALRDGLLTVRFGRPIEASFGRVARSLGKYIASVTPGDDGQSVVFDLKGDFNAYSYDSGSAVIVEFADKSPSAADKPEAEKPEAEKKAETKPENAAPSDPEAASGASPDLPVVRVRSGRHPDYTRIVFDWPSKVAYSFKQVGGVATVTFERAARIDLGRIRSRRLPYIGGVRSRTGADSVTVTLSVPATSKVRHFLAGQKVVLDVRRPSGSEKAAPLPPPAAEGEATKAAKADSAPETPPKTSPTAEDIRETPSPAAKPGAKTAKAAPQAAPQVLKPVAEETAAKPAPPGPGQPTKLTPVRSSLSSPGSQAAAAPSPQGILSPGTPPPLPPTPATVTANASSDDVNAVTLRFDWDEPVGAAVFRRAGFLWVAFDRPTAIDIDQLRQAGGKIIKGIEQMGTPQATVLRMATLAGINPSLRRDGLAWLLDFRKQPIEAVTSITVKAQPESPVGARLFLPLPEPGTPIGVTDPEVGDNFVIVPVIPLGHGTGLEYIYPQVRFLQTSQGIVILPRNDDIRVRTLRQGIEVSSSGELLISEVTPEDEANRRRAAMKPLTRILSLDRWKLKNINAFRDRKYELLAAISQAKGNQREAARLDLIRFFFANGFNAEALAILKEAARTRAEIEQDPEFRMLRGGTHYMLGRLPEAYNDFNLEALNVNDEAVFWRAIVRAAAGDMTDAASDLTRTGQIVRPYPKALKTPLGTMVIRTALEIGDIKQARHFLEILRLDKLTPPEKSQFDFEEGRLMELAGDFDAAVSIWEKVINGYHRPSRAKATVARMELLLKLNRMTPKEAIKDLEKLRFAWRGDEFEFTMLRRLGTLYLEEGLYRQGLDRLRKAATHYRTHEEAIQVTQQMSDTFTDLYLNDGADVLAPVTAIALYDEFKELTPAGVQGDEMIRKLADRLVGVDLLDRAATLLNSQVRFRLQGLEKARVGTQLALVHILDRKYKEALQVLDETAVPDMPDPLQIQRRHLRAKGLLGMDNREQTLAVLKGDKTLDGELLLSEVYWTSRDWSNAAQSLQRLIRLSQAKPGEALDAKQASHILNYAVAL